jgi:hypothetical protein
MVSGTDHQHRYRHLRTEDSPQPEGEAGTTSAGKVDVFYCEVCLQYQRVQASATTQPPHPFSWMRAPGE